LDALISVAGKGCYQGTISCKYRYAKSDISKASVKVADQIYTGNPIEPYKADLTKKQRLFVVVEKVTGGM